MLGGLPPLQAIYKFSSDIADRICIPVSAAATGQTTSPTSVASPTSSRGTAASESPWGIGQIAGVVEAARPGGIVLRTPPALTGQVKQHRRRDQARLPHCRSGRVRHVRHELDGRGVPNPVVISPRTHAVRCTLLGAGRIQHGILRHASDAHGRSSGGLLTARFTAESVLWSQTEFRPDNDGACCHVIVVINCSRFPHAYVRAPRLQAKVLEVHCDPRECSGASFLVAALAEPEGQG